MLEEIKRRLPVMFEDSIYLGLVIAAIVATIALAGFFDRLRRV